MSEKQFTNICFTSWEKKGLYLMDIFSYLLIGEEVCPMTGRPHLQGYAELKTKRRLSTIKKALLDPALHVEQRYGSQLAAIVYCKKDGKFQEWGTPKGAEPGSLEEVCGALFTTSLDAVAMENPELYVRHFKGLMSLRQVYLRHLSRSFRPVECFLYWGETGTGKTRKAFAHNDVYFLPNPTSSVWFDGYDGESVLIIDEYTNGLIDNRMLLQICDGYPIPINVKGSMTAGVWSKVIFTSNYDFNQLFGAYNYPLRRRLPEENCLFFSIGKEEAIG